MIHEAIVEAYSVLDGKPLSRDLADRLAELKGPDILDLVSLANKVRHAFACEAHVCTIMNAKSGACGENCRFCAQSVHHEADVDVYPLAETGEMIQRADAAYATGVRSFGIVTSGTGFLTHSPDFQRVLDGIDAIYARHPDMSVCASLGVLSDDTARALSEHRVVHYNINIQTNPSRYDELISTTHDVHERMKTIALLQKYNVKVCCGGIIGVGETAIDRVEMAYALKDLDVDVIPLNVLVPIDGTPLESQEAVPVSEIAKSFALFRLVNPSKTIKFAAGRETVMKDFQGLLMLAGANGFLTGGYLTTRGRAVEDDFQFGDELLRFGGGAR
ncbi:MAG: biotin synthase BioB [Kiritimatiellae bacterium]|nr:biotin synthase BioB [Kiritimatiellia bacterium]